MIINNKSYDAVILGGGMYGLYSAYFLSNKGKKVAVIERESKLFSRASKINQARLHRGYHYPRAIDTAKQTNKYYKRFIKDFDFAILDNFKQYYAIAMNGSKLNARAYEKFCSLVGIPLKEVDSNIFFKTGKVQKLYEVEEAAFDFSKIENFFIDNLYKNSNVDIYLGSYVTNQKNINGKYILNLNTTLDTITTSIVINATYSNINMVNNIFGFSGYQAKYELCELKICKTNLGKKVGVTVFDGNFFSIMPYGDGTLSTLSSVRHTPIHTTYDNPTQIKDFANKKCNGNKMENLAKNFLKKDFSFNYLESIYEIKPILVDSEETDSRPTLIRIHKVKPYFISVFSGKLSTIYELDPLLKKLTKI